LPNIIIDIRQQMGNLAAGACREVQSKKSPTSLYGLSGNTSLIS
jgi:hypothetical protein